jgi:replication factor A2
MTIKQLQNAPANANGEQGFTLAGNDLHQVTIVGIIVSADEQNTNLQYTIDDGTGSIVAKMWVDADQDEAMAERRAEWKEGRIVRVVGQLRVFNHTRSIVAFTIQPIKDYNEYTYHFIEVVHTHLHLTKGKAPAGAPAQLGAWAARVGGAQPLQAAGGSGGAAAPQAAAPGGAQLQDTVLNFFKQYAETEIGCTAAECFEATKAHGARPARVELPSPHPARPCCESRTRNLLLPRAQPANQEIRVRISLQVTLQEIRSIVDNLTSEGHLYSTVDDNHFKGI